MSDRCTRGDCDRDVKAHGLCQMHYDRERSRHRTREDRVLATRARNRANAALIKAHTDEFSALLTKCITEVHEEHARIVALAEEMGVDVADNRRIFRLKRGPAAEDEAPEERAQYADPTSCPACSDLHERGHACPTCASNQKLETRFQSRQPAPAYARNTRVKVSSADAQIERALRAGKSASWVSAQLGEPMVVVMTVLQRLRKERDEATA